MNETPQQAARRLSQKAITQGFKPEALHAYTDELGRPLHWRIRLKHPTTGEKWIRPMKLENGAYTLGELEYPKGKPVYRLHEVAARPNELVLITEGEWCADALEKVGVLATTSGAADSAPKADWQPLTGRAVRIWPDNDEPGKRYAESVAAELLPLGCTVRVIDVQRLGLPAKGDAVDWLAANPAATPSEVHSLPTVEAPAQESPYRVQLLSAADLTPEPVKWLWPGWLAAGKLHVLAGAPGTGKTTLALALGATITTGGRWPDGLRAELGDLLIWSGEDDPKDTLIPRLIACGANRGRVHIVADVIEDGDRRSFDPARDVKALREAAKSIGRPVRLLIVDPIVSAVAADSHKNGEVRRALQPLVDLGAAMGCAVLGISHFSKGTAGRDPVDRVTGSIAFGALARVVLAAAKIPDDEKGGRLLARAKSNIGPDSGGFRYDLEQCEIQDFPGVTNTRVLWGEAIEGTARELLGNADEGEGGERNATQEATDFLRDILASGPVKAGDVTREAKQAGISEKSLRRAREKLGIKPKKLHFAGGWAWELPGEDAQHSQDALPERVGTLGTLGHLREDSVEVEI